MPDSRPVIAHVLHRLYLAGAEVLAAELSRSLRERYRFVFLCLDQVGPLGEQLAGEGFGVVDLRRRPGLDARVVWRLKRALRRYRVNLVHAHQYTPFFYSSLGRAPTGPPLIFTEHGRHWPDIRKLRRVLANRALLRNDDCVTAVGEFVRQALVENENIPLDRIEVIYNGIDPARFGEGDAAAARQAMGVGPDDLVVLQVARFHEVKDHITGLEAFARVVECVPRARLVLVGDGDERPRIEEAVRELGISQCVTLMGVRSDVAALLPGADVFMLSSLSEGISLTVLEAMAARLPVAATAVGGNVELIEHGRNGLLSPRQDSEALAKNLVLLLHDPEVRRRSGDAGRNLVLKRFSQAQMHQAYEQVYEQMLG